MFDREPSHPAGARRHPLRRHQGPARSRQGARGMSGKCRPSTTSYSRRTVERALPRVLVFPARKEAHDSRDLCGPGQGQHGDRDVHVAASDRVITGPVPPRSMLRLAYAQMIRRWRKTGPASCRRDARCHSPVQVTKTVAPIFGSPAPTKRTSCRSVGGQVPTIAALQSPVTLHTSSST